MLKKKIVVIDTETGGLDKNIHSLLTVGILYPQTNSAKELKHSLPQYVVTPEAMRINRLDLADLKLNGMNTATLTSAVGEVLSDSDNSVFVGHNLQFDANFLGVLDPSFVHKIMRNHIDTKALTLNAILQGKLPETQGTGLADLAKYFGVSAKGHHDALVDARLTYEVYLKLNLL